MTEEKLSKAVPYVRVAFYEANGKMYFGEITFFHFSEMVPFEPNDYDELWGEWDRIA